MGSKWDEEVYECENDIMGLCISFLIVQACRFNITGILPNSLGIEEKKYVHGTHASLLMALLAFLSAVSTIVLVRVHGMFPKEVTPGTFLSLCKRMMIALRITASMCIAWCLMTLAKWRITWIIGDPNLLHSRVILACVVSVFAFVIILVLDKVADLDCTGRDTDTAIFSFIWAHGILVGFSWEQSFDGALEVIAEHAFDPTLATLMMATAVAIFVIYPWRLYILPRVIRKEKEWDSRHGEETVMAIGGDEGVYQQYTSLDRQ